ncbi:MAG: M48 family metalloprotease [Thiotrichales bacterium]|nr:M48 family metalloprotease [Thiotrichales bacterium]
MKLQPLLAIVFAALWLIGCAGGGGPILADPTVSQSDVNQARRTLATHRLAPSLNPPNRELFPRLARVWQSTRPAIRETCRRTFSSGCDASVNQMRIVLVPHESVNAYADASNFTIGVHTGFMRSAGDDDEIAAVLAHEAAHLLFGHAQKKASNAATGGLLGGIAMGALGAALHQPGMNTDYIGDMAESGFNAGWNVGRLAYSPEMEIEADQFAMYVLKQAERRLTAGTDLIVRLHRVGDTPKTTT